MAFKDEVGSLDRIAKAVEEMAEGSALPEPTVEDAGLFLGVNDSGQYELMEGGGGGSYLAVEIGLNPGTGVFSLNKTYAQIKEAYEDRILVVFYDVLNNYQTTNFSYGQDDEYFVEIPMEDSTKIFETDSYDGYPEYEGTPPK